MATQLGKAYVQIIPSAKGISGAIQQELSGQGGLGSAGETMGTSLLGGLKGAVIGGLATLGIGAAVKQFVSGAISEGAALQQSLGGVETLFKDSAGKVKAYADEAYKSTGLSANKYMENVTGFSASLLSSLHGDTARAAEAANSAMVDMSDNANKFGTDMQSIQYAYQGFAKQNYTMLDNLKLGYGGTKEEMQRLLSDAEKLTGKHFDISNFADVTEAIHAIQTEMGVTGTTAREAATTFTGSFESMKSAAQNLLGKIALGQNIAPALQSLLSATSTFIFGNFIPMLGNIGKGLITVFSEIGPAIQKALGNGSNFSDTVYQFMASFIYGIIDAIPQVISGFQSLMTGIFDFLKQQGPAMITNAGGLLEELANGLISNIPNLVKAAFAIVSSFAGFLLENLPALWQSGADLIISIVQGIITNLPELVNAFVSGLDTLRNTITEHLPEFVEKGITVITNLVVGIIQALPSLAASALKIIVSFDAYLVSHFPQIITGGFKLLGQLIVGIIQAIPKIASAVLQIIGKFGSYLASHFPQIVQKGVELLGKLIQGITNSIGKIGNVVSQVKNKLIGGLSNINLFHAGKAIIDGFLNGLRGAWNAGKHFIEKIAPWIKAKKGPIEYDRVLLKDEGQAIMQGLHEGIQTTFKNKVQPLVLGMAGQIQNAFGSPTLALGGVDTNSQIEISSLAINSRLNELASVKDKETEYLDTLRKMAERPTVVSLKLDENEFARLTAEPISKEQEYNKTILDRLKGENRWL